MEIPGDLCKPFLGMVNQLTFRPASRLLPWKMSRIVLDLTAFKNVTNHNAVPDFTTTGRRGKRTATGTVELACYDPAFTTYNLNPFSTVAGLGVGFRLEEGLKFRMALIPDTSVARAGSTIGETVGTPIAPTGLGALTELIGPGGAFATLPALTYIFLGLECTKIHHEADCAKGQPFSFDFESTYAYGIPGEGVGLITTYGYSPAVWSSGTSPTSPMGFW